MQCTRSEPRHFNSTTATNLGLQRLPDNNSSHKKDARMTSDKNLKDAAALISQNSALVRRVAQDCRTYYTGLISEDMVITWLLQFRTPERVSDALKVLEHLHFIDSTKLVILLKTAFRKVPEPAQQTALLAAIGKTYDSAVIVGYNFAKALGKSEDELTNRFVAFGTELWKQAIDEQKPVILLDDNITSGTQLKQVFSEMFDDHAGPREHLKQALPHDTLSKLGGIEIHVIFAVELGDGRNRISRFARERGLNISIWSGHQDLTHHLEFGGPIWTTEEDANHAKSTFSTIGATLFSDKDWSAETLKDRLLGYGNLQKRTVFSHNILRDS